MRYLILLGIGFGGPVLMAQRTTFKIPIKSKVLDNGLTVLVVETHDAPLVSVQVWYKVGSRNEHEGITGISHMLEHMMFKGTEKIGPEEYSEIIQRYGGTSNAFTAEDVTAYWSVLPSSKVEVALELEADRMQNAVFREFESEKNVVMEERRWRTDNSPWSALYEQVRAAAFVSHPYHNPVIGWMDDLKSITLDDVRKHYETYYTPNNAILVISGDIDADRAFNLAEKYFGDIPKGPTPPPVRSVEPPQRGERKVKVRKEGFTYYFDAAYHIPKFTDPDMPAIEVLANILGRGKSSRFYRVLVQEKGLANNVWVWANDGLDPSLFFISATLQRGKTPEEFEEVLDSLIKDVQTNGVTDEELERAKEMLSANFVYSLQSTQGRGMAVGEYTILGGKANTINEYIPRLMKVTRDDVMRVAQKYLIEDNRTIGIFEPIPPKDIQAYLKKMKEGSKKEFRR